MDDTVVRDPKPPAKTPELFLLTQEIEAFLFEEADLIDERRFSD